jgi:exodeoxyribonuclease VII large subunit
MISHVRVKTPTAAAAFLIDHLQQVLDTIEDAQNRLASFFSVFKTRQEAHIDALAARIPLLLERRLTTERHRLQLLEEKAKALDPTLLLRRGYSITLKDGRLVRDPRQLNEGDIIETRLEKGSVSSVVKGQKEKVKELKK